MRLKFTVAKYLHLQLYNMHIYINIDCTVGLHVHEYFIIVGLGHTGNSSALANSYLNSQVTILKWPLGSVHLKSVGGGPENGGQARTEFM